MLESLVEGDGDGVAIEEADAVKDPDKEGVAVPVAVQELEGVCETAAVCEALPDTDPDPVFEADNDALGVLDAVFEREGVSDPVCVEEREGVNVPLELTDAVPVTIAD